MQFVRKKKRARTKRCGEVVLRRRATESSGARKSTSIRVPARFQACVRILIPDSNGELRQMWDFVNHNRRL